SGSSPAQPSRATSSILTAACWADIPASSTSPSASGGGSASPPAIPLFWGGFMRPPAPGGSAPPGRFRPPRMRRRRGNWLGEDTIDHALCGGWHEVFVKVRSTRPPQPAWLSRGGAGVEVDLLDGEDGVSPGQACVFYDAAEGQARVLGGGFIQSAVAATH